MIRNRLEMDDENDVGSLSVIYNSNAPSTNKLTFRRTIGSAPSGIKKKQNLNKLIFVAVIILLTFTCILMFNITPTQGSSTERDGTTLYNSTENNEEPTTESTTLSVGNSSIDYISRDDLNQTTQCIKNVAHYYHPINIDSLLPNIECNNNSISDPITIKTKIRIIMIDYYYKDCISSQKKCFPSNDDDHLVSYYDLENPPLYFNFFVDYVGSIHEEIPLYCSFNDTSVIEDDSSTLIIGVPYCQELIDNTKYYVSQMTRDLNETYNCLITNSILSRNFTIEIPKCYKEFWTSDNSSLFQDKILFTDNTNSYLTIRPENSSKIVDTPNTFHNSPQDRKESTTDSISLSAVNSSTKYIYNYDLNVMTQCFKNPMLYTYKDKEMLSTIRKCNNNSISEPIRIKTKIRLIMIDDYYKFCITDQKKCFPSKDDDHLVSYYDLKNPPFYFNFFVGLLGYIHEEIPLYCSSNDKSVREDDSSTLIIGVPNCKDVIVGTKNFVIQTTSSNIKETYNCLSTNSILLSRNYTIEIPKCYKEIFDTVREYGNALSLFRDKILYSNNANSYLGSYL